MSKPKDKKERPDKYEQKVQINKGFEATLKLFADQANKTVQKKKPNTEQ